MHKFLSLLKYLDRSKVTPEAVMEIAAILKRSPTLEQAAEVANTFRTRGEAGLLACVPEMLSWSRSTSEGDSALLACPHCGAFIQVSPDNK